MASAALLGGISAIGNIAGGLFGNKGANEALKLLQQGKVDASALNYLLYGLTRGDMSPYTNAGASAVNQLAYLLGIGGGKGGQVPSGTNMQSILNKPMKSITAGMDGKLGTISATGSGQFFWTPGSGQKRTFQFLYNDGQNDVYQLTGGGKGTGVNIDFAVVNKNGEVSFTGNPPIPNMNAGQGSGIPAGAENDPAFGSLMRDFSAQDFQTDPGYQFRLTEGQKALERSAAARGGLYSGRTLKDLTNYNQGFASNEYTNAYNRFQQNRATKYNQLASLAGMGQVSANTVAGATNNLAGNLTGITMQSAGDMANARASGYSAMGKGFSSGLNDLANGIYNWYLQNKNSGGGASSGGGGGNGGTYVGNGIYI